MVIKAFKNKIILLANGSYSQYFEAEKDTSWIEKPDKFNEFVDDLENAGETFSVKVGKEGKKGVKRDVSGYNMKKVVEDINSCKIKDKKNAANRYLRDIYPDKEFLSTKNIADNKTPSYKLKKLFNDF